jgi:segregation and condensation protein B
VTTDGESEPLNEQGIVDSTADEDGPNLPLPGLIESLLFVASEPVSIDHLSSALEVAPEAVEEGLKLLAQECSQRGVRVQRRGRRVQMVTAPEASELVRKFLGLELSGRLSPAAMETLAIIAYRQPMTRAEVEAIRGVNSDSTIRTLLNRGLIEEQGRLEQPGRPIVYGTTFDFLQQFGLTALDQLPPLRLVNDSNGQKPPG